MTGGQASGMGRCSQPALFFYPHNARPRSSKLLGGQLEFNMHYKQPRSVQVVIFTEDASIRQYLLLKRVVSHGEFWQSVTGSLEAGETHAQAAIREVKEETGIIATEEELIDLGVINTFEIAPQWRAEYAPGVTHNEEVCFTLRSGKCDVRLDPTEHTAYTWVDYETALKMLYWDSSKRAITAAEALLSQSRVDTDAAGSS
jgi:dATP pyrophosphohydrolase